MRVIGWCFATLIAVIGVIDLVVALVIVLLLGVGFAVWMFLRARDMDKAFTEILKQQQHQRVLLSSGRPSPPRPLPRPGR